MADSDPEGQNGLYVPNTDERFFFLHTFFFNFQGLLSFFIDFKLSTAFDT